ncbi:hypothetical protein [Variovorax sp. 770b2]|uniref:hypothetical protein n=1 Tax=Variovorax sp. 770b2 TaxID=1566271 RepID=UPI0011604A47|nr:hypothetical protein [Variovorax sp. 770b2]
MADEPNITNLVEAWAGSSPENLGKMALALQKARSKLGGGTPVEHARFLKKATIAYDDLHSFIKGDLVTWKEGLRDRLHPEPGWPAIVLDVFIDPVVDPVQDSQSSSYRREFDMLCGVVIDGAMYTFHFESRRLKKYEDDWDDEVL